MRAGVHVLLLMTLAGFESVLSASLEAAGVHHLSDDRVDISELQKRDDLRFDEKTEAEAEERLQEGDFMEASRDEDLEEMTHEDKTDITDFKYEDKTDDDDSTKESEVVAVVVDMGEMEFKKIEDEESEEDSDSFRSKREHEDIEEVKDMVFEE